MIQVYHFKHAENVKVSGAVFVGMTQPEFNKTNYEKVAEVKIDDGNYDDVFRLTNHIDSPWWDNPGVFAVIESEDQEELKHRSTSVGDVIVLNSGDVMMVGCVGWEKIEYHGDPSWLETASVDDTDERDNPFHPWFND